MENYRLLVLGGTRISCEIVEQAKRMEYYVAVTDYNEPQDSPAKLIADESFMVSATDVDGVVDLVARERMDGVMVGFADVLLPYYADICEKAGLPSMGTRRQFELFTDKNKYKSLLNRYGIPAPRSVEVQGHCGVAAAAMAFPVIVKPADSSGARGCIICSSASELQVALDEALGFSRNGTAIVEELVKGPEVTAFYMVQDGKAYCTALANRHVENNQGEGVLPLPVGYTFPSKLTGSYLDDISPKVCNMLESEGIKNGMLFMQCAVSDGVPKVYDLGMRLTGSLEYYVLGKACGFNPLEMMVRYSVTGDMGDPIEDKVDPFLNGKFGWNVSALIKPGVIGSFEGLEKLSGAGDLVKSVLSYKDGEKLETTDIGLLKQIACRFIGVSDTREKMREAVDYIVRTFDVLDGKGNSLLLPQMDLRKYNTTY